MCDEHVPYQYLACRVPSLEYSGTSTSAITVSNPSAGSSDVTQLKRVALIMLPVAKITVSENYQAYLTCGLGAFASFFRVSGLTIFLVRPFLNPGLYGLEIEITDPSGRFEPLSTTHLVNIVSCTQNELFPTTSTTLPPITTADPNVTTTQNPIRSSIDYTTHTFLPADTAPQQYAYNGSTLRDPIRLTGRSITI